MAGVDVGCHRADVCLRIALTPLHMTSKKNVICYVSTYEYKVRLDSNVSGRTSSLAHFTRHFRQCEEYLLIISAKNTFSN